jgi:hypothetical protein
MPGTVFVAARPRRWDTRFNIAATRAVLSGSPPTVAVGTGPATLGSGTGKDDDRPIGASASLCGGDVLPEQASISNIHTIATGLRFIGRARGGG